MREADFDIFAGMIDAVASLLPPPQPLTDTARAMFFRAISTLSIDQVRTALDAHVRDPQRGRFFPKPADVMAQTSDDRPGADEAWAIAIRGRDESASIVWNAEISEAWGIARAVLELGDEVGARIAFRDAYQRIVIDARKVGKTSPWFASLGHDSEGRVQALREEARLNRTAYLELGHDAPKRGGQPLLPTLVSAPEHIRARLQQLRDSIVNGTSETEVISEDAQNRIDTDRMKRASAVRAQAYASEHGIDLASRT